MSRKTPDDLPIPTQSSPAPADDPRGADSPGPSTREFARLMDAAAAEWRRRLADHDAAGAGKTDRREGER